MHSDPNSLFSELILPAYPSGWNGKVKGDLIIQAFRSGIKTEEISPIKNNRDQIAIVNQINKMKDIGLKELGTVLKTDFKSLEDAIIKIDSWYTESNIDCLIEDDPKLDPDGISDLFIRTVEISAIIGNHLIELDQELTWCPTLPYWESPLHHAKTGSLINVYHWTIKRFTKYGINDNLISKCHACINAIKN